MIFKSSDFINRSKSNIHINSNGVLVHNISGFNIKNMLVFNNTVVINLSNKKINLAFSSNNEAKDAKVLLQNMLDSIRLDEYPIFGNKHDDKRYILLDTLKDVVSDSIDFNDFKNKIALL